MHYTLYELKLCLKSKLFLFSLLLSLFCFLIGIFGNKMMISMEKGLTIFFSGFNLSRSSIFPLLAPSIAALPMADSYLKDTNNQMVNAIFSRETKNKYYWNKFLAVGIAGCLALIVPLTLLLIINLMIHPQLVHANIGAIQGAFSKLYQKNQLFYAVVLIINSGIFGFIYANIGLTASFFFKNKYICVFFPFLIYTIPSFIFPFIGLDRYEPLTTLDVTANANGTVTTIYLQLITLLVITFFLGIKGIKNHE